jgi:hypothetical protein
MHGSHLPLLPLRKVGNKAYFAGIKSNFPDDSS